MKPLTTHLKILLSTLILLMSFSVFATNYETDQDGDWKDKSTWKNNKQPGNKIKSGDHVYIKHDVDLDDDIDEIKGTLEIQSTGSLTGSKEIKKVETGGNLIVDGELDIEKIEFKGGNCTATATITVEEFKVDGSTTFTTSAPCYITDKFEVKNATNITFNDTVSIDDINKIENSTVSFSGGVFVDDKIDIDGKGSTISFGSNSYIDDDFKIKDCTLNISGNFEVKKKIELKEDCTMTNSGIITADEFKLKETTSDFTNNGTVNVEDFIVEKGDAVNNGTINCSDDFEMKNSASFTNNGQIDVSDKFKMEDDATFSNDATLNADEFDLKNDATFTNDDDGDLTVTNRFRIIDSGGSLTNSGTVTLHCGGSNESENEGTITNNSGATITINGEFENKNNIVNNGTFNANGEFTNEDDITNTGDFNVGGEFTNEDDITNTGDFNISGEFTNEDDFTNNGNLNLISDENGYGTYIEDGGTTTGSGQSRTELLLTEDDWHYISLPVDIDSTNALWGAAVYSYSEFTNTWQAHVANEQLQPMKGYDVYYSEDKTIVFSGEFNEGSFSNTYLTYNNDGYNFVGNPYPSSIDWDASSGWTKTNLDNAIYIWDPVAQAITSYIDGVGANGGGQYIPPMQGFFVKCSTSGVNGTLGMTDDVRLHNSDATFRNSDNGKEIIRLKVKSEKNGYTDETVIRFDNKSTAKFDSYCDANKMFSNNNSVSQIYTKSSDAKDMSINTIPEFDNELIIPLYTKIGVSGKNTIFIDADNFSFSANIYLEDLKENKMFDFGEGEYSFYADVNEKTDRFILHFVLPQQIDNNKEINTAIENNTKNNNVNINSVENTVTIKMDVDKAVVTIIDITGKVVVNKEIIGNNNEITVDVDAGYYIVNVRTEKNNYSEKIFIK
ncbi:MAG: T9SS type A sorting domain-containing protein [Bacteroidota bacterium]|nr:T9SS type A sorting domain-containing protein [Bacteroidota bacterium]